MRFISSLTPQQIEQRLVRMAKAIITDDIATSVDSSSKDNEVCSAKAVYKLKQLIEKLTSGDDLKKAINDATDSNVFTDTLKTRLENITDAFHSVQANQGGQDAIDTSNLKVGSVILILDTGDGQASFRYWGGSSAGWVDIYPVYPRNTINFGSTAEQNRALWTYKTTKIGGAKLTIYARRHDNHRQTIEVTLLHRETSSGNDVVLMAHGGACTDINDILTNIVATSVGNDVTLYADSVANQAMIVKVDVNHQFPL